MKRKHPNEKAKNSNTHFTNVLHANDNLLCYFRRYSFENGTKTSNSKYLKPKKKRSYKFISGRRKSNNGVKQKIPDT